MPEHEMAQDGPRESRARSAAAPGGAAPTDPSAVLEELDRASRLFNSRFASPRQPEQAGAGRADTTTPSRQGRPREADAATGGRGAVPGDQPPATPSDTAERSLEQRMREAEREARAYLDQAKQRADQLVATMVGAVEREAAEIRRDAEAGIQARWQRAESEAEDHVEAARRVASDIVATRRQRIASLSDGISDRAGALTASMEDAERVRAQFDAFVRALSATADRIASDPEASAGELHDLGGGRRPSTVAA